MGLEIRFETTHDGFILFVSDMENGLRFYEALRSLGMGGVEKGVPDTQVRWTLEVLEFPEHAYLEGLVGILRELGKSLVSDQFSLREKGHDKYLVEFPRQVKLKDLFSHFFGRSGRKTKRPSDHARPRE
ncbi:MAG: hypothetical protein ACTSU5_22380 [Promethearchaeota archaeon]